MGVVAVLIAYIWYTHTVSSDYYCYQDEGDVETSEKGFDHQPSCTFWCHLLVIKLIYCWLSLRCIENDASSFPSFVIIHISIQTKLSKNATIFLCA